MPAYLIADLDITDQERFSSYQRDVPRLIEKHGGTYVVRGGNPETLEGSWEPRRVVVLRFPNRAAVRALLDDPEYEPLKAVRQQSSAGNLIAVDGVEQS